jgi:exo-beta-1,3-glucanase (GH17 family)
MTSVLFLILIGLLSLGLVALLPQSSRDAAEGRAAPASTAPLSFLSYLQDSDHPPALIAYSPLNFDPTHTDDHTFPTIDSIRTDLHALRPGFDGLILSRYDAGLTPDIVAEAIAQDYRAVLLGIWDPLSEEELDGTVNVVKTYGTAIALAVCIGNGGISFNRYTLADVLLAAEQLGKALGPRIPLCTSEPLRHYAHPLLRAFGDFLAPAIHPVMERPRLTPEGSAYWAREQALRLAQLATKPVLVKETGFPHAGALKYTPISQRRFWRSYLMDPPFIRLSVDPPIWISYAAAFEAFDHPWTAQQSLLAMEQSWGLLTRTRTPSPSFLLWSPPPRPLDGQSDTFPEREAPPNESSLSASGLLDKRHALHMAPQVRYSPAGPSRSIVA